jgi:transcription initiation factor IIE alpha subunit
MCAIGVTADVVRPLIFKIALDCMPAIRRAVFSKLVHDEHKWETPELATKLGYPTQTTRRTLEDLTAHGLIIRHKNGQADQWNLSDLASTWYQRATRVFPDIYQ